jgi:hypothetical protein
VTLELSEDDADEGDGGPPHGHAWGRLRNEGDDNHGNGHAYGHDK